MIKDIKSNYVDFSNLKPKIAEQVREVIVLSKKLIKLMMLALAIRQVRSKKAVVLKKFLLGGQLQGIKWGRAKLFLRRDAHYPSFNQVVCHPDVINKISPETIKFLRTVYGRLTSEMKGDVELRIELNDSNT